MREAEPRLSLIPVDDGDARDPALSARTDDELMLLARGGLGAAFDTLVRRYQGRVLRVAARRTGRSALAPDIAQNAFIDLYRAIPRYQARGHFSAYLYRAVLNRCRMAERSARSEGRFALTLYQPATETVLAVPSAALSAEAMVLARERERDVHAAIVRLSRKLREVVSLRYGAGLSYDEIADTLDLPLGTVKRRLFDAIEKLRAIMEGP